MAQQQQPKRPSAAGDLSELFLLVERDEEAAKAAERRRRHRESMARGRTRRGATMAAMRAEHAALVQRQQALLAARQSRSLAAPGATERFFGAVEAANALHQEREQLARRLEQLEIFEAVLRVDTPPASSDSDATTTSSTSSSGGAARSQTRPDKEEGAAAEGAQEAEGRVPGGRGRFVYFTPEEPPFYFEPVSARTCHAWAVDAFQRSRRHHARFSRRRAAPAGASGGGRFLGWRVRRSLADSVLHFHFSKRFPAADPLALASRLADGGWALLTDPAAYARLYRTVLIVKVLQRVGACNCLLLRNSPSPDRSHHLRSVTFMARVDDVDERGRRVLAIVNLVTDPRQERAPPKADATPVRYIRDATTYIMLTVGHGDEAGADGEDDWEEEGEEEEDEEEPTDGPYVEMTYGGHGDCLNEAQAQYLFVETGHVLFRFEQVLHPRHLVTGG